jgi:hypothetical protein
LRKDRGKVEKELGTKFWFSPAHIVQGDKIPKIGAFKLDSHFEVHNPHP